MYLSTHSLQLPKIVNLNAMLCRDIYEAYKQLISFDNEDKYPCNIIVPIYNIYQIYCN